MRFLRLIPLALLLTLTVPACSSDDDDSNGSNSNNPSGSETPGTVSADITAEDGGSVTLGGASLSIPGGALTDDTTITMASTAPAASLPDKGSVQGLVYELGPEGTTFTGGVALTLPLANAPGSGKEAVISYLNEDQHTWEDLPTQSASDGTVSASITHFSKYVVRIKNTNVDMSPGPVDCSFKACGGDPTGTWKIADACLESDVENPLANVCPSGTFDVSLSADGTLTVADGRYTWNLTVSGEVNYSIPADCLASLDASDCATFAGDSGDTLCTGSAKAGCSCKQTNAPEMQTSTGTLEVKGNQIIGTDDESGEAGEPEDFCVQGNTLKVMIHEANADGTTNDILLAFTK